MGRRGGVVIGILLIVLAFLLMGSVLDSFGAVSRTESSNAATVATGVGVTTGNITLHSSLYGSNTNEVYNLTSSNTSDVPLAATYTVATQQLNVSGLLGNSSRTLTAYYYTERDDYSIASIASFTPFVLFLVLVLSGIGLCWQAMRG